MVLACCVFFLAAQAPGFGCGGCSGGGVLAILGDVGCGDFGGAVADLVGVGCGDDVADIPVVGGACSSGGVD
jgi:hypothetical protein